MYLKKLKRLKNQLIHLYLKYLKKLNFQMMHLNQNFQPFLR